MSEDKECAAYRIAKDGSYTITHRAARLATEHILNDLLNGYPHALCSGHIFATLTMAEGYDDATVHALAANPHYREEIILMQKIIMNELANLADLGGTNV